MDEKHKQMLSILHKRMEHSKLKEKVIEKHLQTLVSEEKKLKKD